MRKIVHPDLEAYRIKEGQFASDSSYRNAGAFRIMHLFVISSGDDEGARKTGWEHVSVSTKDKCPTWEEMCVVKNLFWGEEETVIQFHPPQSKNISRHPYCLHLWKMVGKDFELPPSILIG